MIPEDKLKTAFEEIDKGNIDAAKVMLDEYKGINPGDWRLSAGYYFASGKDDKEYIMKAARSAHETEGVGEDIVASLMNLRTFCGGSKMERMNSQRREPIDPVQRKGLKTGSSISL